MSDGLLTFKVKPQQQSDVGYFKTLFEKIVSLSLMAGCWREFTPKTPDMQLGYNKMKFILLIVCLVVASHAVCHYSCKDNFSCGSPDYYNCTACGLNRGNSGVPINGMCYCDNSSDQDQNGACINSGSYNTKSKVMIILFISFTLVLATFSVFVKGMKYFLYKTIEDIQELSLIVFINLYIPQQLDIFLTYLYSFNISSYTFQNIAQSSLFTIMPDASLVPKDSAQTIYGKYRLLQKTANFFSNQFTWMIVFFCMIVVAVLLRFWRNWLKKRRDFEVIRMNVQKNLQESHQQLGESVIGQGKEWVEVVRKDKNQGKITLYSVVSKLYNMIWFNVLIVFFYFSLIEININIFTQIANLTFSSSFANTGAFFSAAFLAAEIVVLLLLFLKAKQEMIKPEWMRDYSYTATIYLIRTNFKSITKYFWFISCLKKIILALIITTLYANPERTIIGICAVHTIYLSIAIYCEPFQRKYIRAHFYITESAKLFLFLALVNFVGQYKSDVELISLASIFYALLAFVFGMHFAFLLLSIIIQKQVYRHFLFKKCCEEDHQQIKQEKIGYRAHQRLYIYVKE